MRRLGFLFLTALLVLAGPLGAYAEEQYISDNALRADPLQGAKQRGQMQVGEFTGAAVYEYPINLPPGRNGLNPGISITYNSQDEVLDNLVGYHWSLNQFSIQRLNKKGVDKLYDRRDFVAETPAGSGELTELGPGLFAERIESGFSKYQWIF